MCLAVPRRILRVDGDRVEVEWDDAPLWVATAGAEGLMPGEYVLVHAGVVLDRVSAEEAEEILALQATLESAWDMSATASSRVEAAP